jgi:energy-coupling factor transporter ATP-binding protein EcfA2
MDHLTMQSKYNYEEVWHWLQAKGRELFGKKFELYPDDKPTIYLLLCWFLNDTIAAPKLKIDLSKGILLTGPIGCGKTTLMHLMKYVSTSPKQTFIMKPCRNISFEFIQDGYEVIHRYTSGSLYQFNPRVYCFDDLGVESTLKYYGNECNTMAEILLTRYDLFTHHQLITHLTTNLSASEIEETYGNRIRSRMREMFNLIAFSKGSEDKRK